MYIKTISDNPTRDDFNQLQKFGYQEFYVDHELADFLFKMYINKKTNEIICKTSGKFQWQLIGESKCAPEDKFDFFVGARLAFKRCLQEVFMFKIREFKSVAKSNVYRLNKAITELEKVNKAYGLNRQARLQGKDYKISKYALTKLETKS